MLSQITNVEENIKHRLSLIKAVICKLAENYLLRITQMFNNNLNSLYFAFVKPVIHKLLTFLIAAIWLINGLFCKILNMVPRHQLIVANILGNEHDVFFTKAIGILETFMAVWILSGLRSRINALAQILIIATMNTIEFIMAPDLLLFGHVNAILAAILILAIYINEFILNRKTALR